MPLNNLTQAQQLLADSARRRLITQALARQGQHGDTVLAHLEPQEAAALQAAGGAGTRNPRTGLPQFYGASDLALDTTPSPPTDFRNPYMAQPTDRNQPVLPAISGAIKDLTGWEPGTTPSWVPQWLRDASASNQAAAQANEQALAKYGMTPRDLEIASGFTDLGITKEVPKIGGLGRAAAKVAPETSPLGRGVDVPFDTPEAPPAAPTIVSRAEPGPGDIQAVLEAARQYGRKGWPTAERGVFATTPEAYAETKALVPQVSVKEQLPGPLPDEKLPLKERAAPVVENTEAIANRIADRLDPMVRAGSPLLNFYHTGPVIRGLEQYGEMPVGEANQFMRDWAGQGAATSPRTQTPPNLRNASFLRYLRESGNPLTPERYAAEGNTPGFPMMGMHVNLADQFARGTVNPLVNPKPSTFREAWSGNLADVTGDTHNIRSTLYEMDQVAPGSLPRGWFNSDAAYSKYRDQGFRALDPGDIADTLGEKTVGGVRRQSEYLPMTEPWRRAADMLGIDPAEGQSGGWFSYGDITGLQSPPKTIPNLLNDQIEATAKTLNVPHEKVVNWWSRGKIPLAGVAGAGLAGAGGLAASGGEAKAAEPQGGNMPAVNNQQQAQQLLRDHARRQLVTQALARQGRGGDTMLAHLSPQEAMALKLAGGVGTRNPATGIPQFYPGDNSDAGEGVGGAGDFGGGVGQGAGFSHSDFERGGGPPGGGVGGSGGGGGSDGDVAAAVGGAGDFGGGVKQGLGFDPGDFEKNGSLPGGPHAGQMSDYTGALAAVKNKPGWRAIGEFVTPGLEQTPVDINKPSTFQGGTYHTDINPGSLVGGFLGGAVAPGLGMLAGPAFGAAYNALGLPDIPTGDWFGGGTTKAPPGQSGTTPGGASPGGGFLSGVGSDLGRAAAGLAQSGGPAGGYGAAAGPSGSNMDGGGRGATRQGDVMTMPAAPPPAPLPTAAPTMADAQKRKIMLELLRRRQGFGQSLVPMVNAT